MSRFIRVTGATDGRVIMIEKANVKLVKDYPASQTWIELQDGTIIQPAESVEHVTKLLEEAG